MIFLRKNWQNFVHRLRGRNLLIVPSVTWVYALALACALYCCYCIALTTTRFQVRKLMMTDGVTATPSLEIKTPQSVSMIVSEGTNVYVNVPAIGYIDNLFASLSFGFYLGLGFSF